MNYRRGEVAKICDPFPIRLAWDRVQIVADATLLVSASLEQPDGSKKLVEVFVGLDKNSIANLSDNGTSPDMAFTFAIHLGPNALQEAIKRSLNQY